MCQQVTSAAHFFQLECVHDFSFRCFVNVFLGQINHLISVHATSHFQSSHFAEIVFIFVGKDVATCEAFDRDDHCVAIRVMGLAWIMIVILHRYF